MTVHQELRGQKRDFGQVGLFAEKSAQYLIFPRSLKAFDGMRIVAIDYEALASKPGSASPAHHVRVREGARKATNQQPAPHPLGRIPAQVVAFPDTPLREAPQKPPHAMITSAKLHWPTEVRKAVEELRAGNTQSASARLQRLLEGAPH